VWYSYDGSRAHKQITRTASKLAMQCANLLSDCSIATGAGVEAIIERNLAKTERRKK